MIKIGLFGLGNVGQGLLRIILENKLPISVEAVVDRSYKNKKNILKNIPASDDPDFILKNKGIDIIVELLGGASTAMFVVREALDSRIPVVTANKTLLAEHGYSLFSKAKENNINIGFEAAVAGAIPIIKNIRTAFAHDKIYFVQGILNGTSNYLLTKMWRDEKSYSIALKDAQKLGLAEADPLLDVNGQDAAQKLAILSSLLDGKWVDYHQMMTKGIQSIQLTDMQWAKKMKLKIRLMATLSLKEDKIYAWVEPMVISSKHFLWDVELENNAVFLQGKYSGPHLFSGKGAGPLPTAYSVLCDIYDVFQKKRNDLIFGGKNWRYANIQSIDFLEHSMYMRMEVEDKPGALANISSILGDNHISISAVMQEPKKEDTSKSVDLFIITHKCKRKNFNTALEDIKKIASLKNEIIYMPFDA